MRKLETWLPVSDETLEDVVDFPKPYMVLGILVWPLEPFDPLVHSLRGLREAGR